ncbi:MAG: hypothetical protein AB1696_00925 [Planctomycetota bacterium]
MLGGRFWKAILLGATLLAMGCEDVAIFVDKDAPAPIRFGASEIAAALKRRRIPYRVLESGIGGRVSIALHVAGAGDPTVPDRAESYALLKSHLKMGGHDSCLVQALGRDTAGTMYAALDVAEQISRARSLADVDAAIEERSRSPFLRVRGVNFFLLKQSMESPDSEFHSADYWRRYIDLLARCRFNFMDIHACYDVMTTDYPNAFPYLIRSDTFPGATPAGVDPDKNLAMLKQIVAIAKDRGIRVGFMNYPAGGVNVPAGRLTEYYRECAAKILKACPDLAMFGFRIGESGQGPDFYRQGVLAGATESKKDIHLYTRTWFVPRQEIMELAREHAGRFFVETKYTGEHLGLPYVVASNRISEWGSCAYQAYTNYPRNYEIIYQVMANGTQRIFHWGDPDFARRCVQSCAFGQAAGCSIETMTAFYPRTNYFLNRDTFPQPYFTWDFERNWFWHMVWGRTAYDPGAPELVWINAFRERFGEEAGEDVYRAVALGSRVVPLIYAVHCLGADRRRMAPEMETGDDHRSRRLAEGNVRVDWRGDILEFSKVGVLDDTVMASIREYADAAVKGNANGKFGPLDAAQRLSEISLSALEHIEKADKAVTHSKDEFRAIRMDVEALRGLAVYYAEKTRAAVALELYRRTRHYALLGDADAYARRAIDAWDDLTDATMRQYRPLIERLRMCTAHFTWEEEGRHLTGDLETIQRVREEFEGALQSKFGGEIRDLVKELREHGEPSRDEMARRHKEMERRMAQHPPDIGHLPVHRAPPHSPIWISATVATPVRDAPAWLYYRRSGEKEFKKTPMTQRPDRYMSAAFIPAEAAAPGVVEYYIEVGQEKAKTQCPDKGPNEPQRVTVSADRSRPVISPVVLDERTRGGKVKLAARVSDGESVASVTAFYRPMPSYYEWTGVAMKKSGEAYEAEVPLTPEGLLYRFEAADANGNATVHPDFLERTPYYVIQSWEPAWVKRDFISFEEGMETYEAAAGQRPFTDSDLKIEAMSVDLKGLVGVRLPMKAARAASLYQGGGIVARFRLDAPARMFVGFGGREMRGWCTRQPGWVPLPELQVKVGRSTLDICCRDYPAGEHSFAFAQGSGVILGFRKLTSKEKRADRPFLLIGGEENYNVVKESFLTVPAEFGIYSPKFGRSAYTDNSSIILAMPKELEGLLGIQLSSFRALLGDYAVPFKLDEPARLYVVFGKPGEQSWEEAHPEFTLYKKGAYKQTDGIARDIYFRDFPAGQSILLLKKGTAVILGFGKLSEIKEKP